MIDMRLSVVIPARNEAENIGPTLDRIRERLKEMHARCTADPGVRLVRNQGPHGFEHAVRCGLDAMTGDAVAIMMADGSDSPDDLLLRA